MKVFDVRGCTPRFRIVMLTGDDRKEIKAEVLPEQKNQIVRRLKAEGCVVAMAGADVGIAMGTGIDVAIQSAGVTLVKGDLSGIVRARVLSRATMGNIRQNLSLARRWPLACSIQLSDCSSVRSWPLRR